MNYYTIYISIIFLVKIVFIILASTHLYLKFKNETNSELDKEVLFWRERVEFIFILLMAILLIFLFNPYKNKMYMINNLTTIKINIKQEGQYYGKISNYNFPRNNICRISSRSSFV